VCSHVAGVPRRKPTARTLYDVTWTTWRTQPVRPRYSALKSLVNAKEYRAQTASIHRPFVVVVVESLHDVRPEGFLAFITLFELSFFLRHELCERPKEAEVENIRVGRVCWLPDKPDDGRLLAVDLPAPGAEFVQIFVCSNLQGTRRRQAKIAERRFNSTREISHPISRGLISHQSYVFTRFQKNKSFSISPLALETLASTSEVTRAIGERFFSRFSDFMS